jgi:hypothetical protein
LLFWRQDWIAHWNGRTRFGFVNKALVYACVEARRKGNWNDPLHEDSKAGPLVELRQVSLAVSEVKNGSFMSARYNGIVKLMASENPKADG